MRGALCGILVLIGLGCEQSQKEYLADLRARQATEELDKKLYLTLAEREVVYGDLRKYFERIYVDECNLR